MRVNSEQSISKALHAHRRFGSWQAVREAATRRDGCEAAASRAAGGSAAEPRSGQRG